MTNVPLKPNRAYPALPAPGGDVTSHAVFLKAVKEAVEIHERRTGNKLDSFLRLRELVDLGLAAIEGEALVPIDFSTGGGSGADDQTASEVPYENYPSGLSATDVQEAIDEIVELLEALSVGAGYPPQLGYAGVI